MAATIATMAMIDAKCLIINSPTKTLTNPSKPSATAVTKPFHNLPKGLVSDHNGKQILSTPLAGTALAGAVFSALSSCDAALAAQQIADIAEGDNRGLALLLPLVPAVAWVLFNILQPALNQLNRMRSSKGFLIGVGLGGVAASGIAYGTPHASAAEIAALAEAGSSDNRGQLLLFVVAPAIIWVLYNILQPALNQLNRMRSQ